MEPGFLASLAKYKVKGQINWLETAERKIFVVAVTNVQGTDVAKRSPPF